MTTPTFNFGQILNPGENIQRLQTGYAEEFTDQHGRRFAAQYDIRNMRPKEELRPVGFAPPWLPPMRYILWDRANSFKFRWDYDTMANDLTEQAQAYYAQVFDFMLEHMPGVEPVELGDPVPAKVLRSPLGKPPLSPAIPLACAAGDPYVLGVPGAPVNALLRDVLEQSATSNGRQALTIIREKLAKMTDGHAVPERAPEFDPSTKPVKSITDIDPASFATVSYREFLTAAMAGGMSMADGAAAWKAHRENLALTEAS